MWHFLLSEFYFITIDGGIEGHIIDDGGNPLANVQVSIGGYTLDDNYYNSLRSYADSASTVSYSEHFSDKKLKFLRTNQ